MSQKNIALQPSNLALDATTLTAGDTDFDGNGPIMYLNASLYVANEFQLGLNCHVRFEETEDDWTTWEGWFTGIILDVRNQGLNSKIVYVVTPPFNCSKTLNGYGTHPIDFGFGGLVQHIDAKGDSDGGWFGGDDFASVTLTFNNITIEVEDPPPPPSDPEQKWIYSYVPTFKMEFKNLPPYKRAKINLPPHHKRAKIKPKK
jgi:hypothetical protein